MYFRTHQRFGLVAESFRIKKAGEKLKSIGKLQCDLFFEVGDFEYLKTGREKNDIIFVPKNMHKIFCIICWASYSDNFVDGPWGTCYKSHIF